MQSHAHSDAEKAAADKAAADKAAADKIAAGKTGDVTPTPTQEEADAMRSGAAPPSSRQRDLTPKTPSTGYQTR